MRTSLPMRKVVALLCLAALLLAVLGANTSASVSVLLAPVWLFIEILVVVSVLRRTDDCDLYAAPFVSAVAFRAPPIA